MGISITLKRPAYERLKRLKEPGESFSDVVMRQLPEPWDTCGEVLDGLKRGPAVKADPQLRKAMLAGRGRRSSRKL